MSNTPFSDFVKIGVNIAVDNHGKKKVSSLPKKWQELTSSIYNNELNYAVLAGQINDIIVVDLDNKGDFPGKKWFEDNFFNLESNNETLVTSTISGGYHVYFKYNSQVINKNNYLNLNIDILSNKKCVYEGYRYDIISNTTTIKQLTESDIKLLTLRKLAKQEDIAKTVTMMKEMNMEEIVISNPRTLRTINKQMSTDALRKWSISLNDVGNIKCVPFGPDCIVDVTKKHSHDEHCALFVNSSGHCCTNCYSDGEVILDKMRSKILQREMNLVVSLQNDELNVFARLKEYMLEIAKENGYTRDKNGNVYSRVKPYAYVYKCEYNEFVSDILEGDKDFERNPKNMGLFMTFLKEFKSKDFPFLNPNKRYLGFKNGMLDTETCIFIPEEKCDGSIVVKKYLDIEFSGETETPLFDSIFDYQLTTESDREDIKRFVYFSLGRLFGIRDKYDFTLFLMGEAGCGKSLVIDVMKMFFRDIGGVSSTFEKTFGLAYLYKKDIIVCDDLPREFSKIMPQTIFQSCISGGEMSIAIKGGDAKTIKWGVPLLFAGNYNPDYVDKGQISRRVLTFEFNRIVPDDEKDTGLYDKIMNSELDKIALKCITEYNRVLNSKKTSSVWTLCPEYFKLNQEELKKDRNPLYKFLVENTECRMGEYVEVSYLRELSKVSKLDKGVLKQVCKWYDVKKMNICKHCNKIASLKCCENGNNKDRRTVYIVMNMVILDSL